MSSVESTCKEEFVAPSSLGERSLDGSVEPVSKYAWYVAFVFALFFVFSFVDRQIIGILVPGMKAGLGLTDIQLSYVGGLSFVVFYTVFGIPLGRMADTYNRKWIIIFGVVVWTVSTAACAFVQDYWSLLGLRMGVGLGEAALAPCAYSILADLFPRKRLSIAISICTMVVALSAWFLHGKQKSRQQQTRHSHR